MLSPEQPVPTDTEAGQPRSKKRLIIGIMLLLCVVILVAGCILMLRRNDTGVTSGRLQEVTPQGPTSSAVDLSLLDSAYDSYARAGVKDLSADKKAATLSAFSSLTQGFGLAPGFFQDKSSVLIGLGIARGSLDHPSQTDGYRNTMYLLAGQYIDSVPSGISDEYFVSPSAADSQTPAVFAKYADQTATSRLRGIMQSSGVEADAARNLGLSGVSALAAYTPLVMNFATGSTGQKQFSAEHHMFGADPKMWVESTSTTTYLVMTKDYGTSFMNNSSGSERFTVLHELIHTQHPFVRGDLGHAIEERRAELFSGDHSAYYDAKQLFIYAEVFSGFSPYDALQKSGTDCDAYYLQLYANLGVAAANAFVVSAPNVFLGQPSAAVRKSQAVFGGMDGAIQAALQIGSSDSSAMNSRIAARSNKLVSVLGSKDKVIADLTNNLAGAYGMPTAADKMKTYIQAH